MTRRIPLLVAVIGINLMACCCGGVGNTPALPQQQQVAKIEEPPAQEEFRFGEPEPSFVFKKTVGTIRIVQVVYCGGVEGGTVRDSEGKCWDW